MSANPPRRGRRPGSESARAQILESARTLFSEVGYDKATIRTIAARAGVDPALVHHFFGTKSELLRASLVLPLDPDSVMAVLDEHPGDEGRALVARVLLVWGDPHVREGFTALLRSAVSHDQARDALRDVLTEGLVRRLSSRIGSDQAELRAGLVATQMAGLALTRLIIGLEPVVRATDAQLVDAIGPTVQRYLTGDLSVTRS